MLLTYYGRGGFVFRSLDHTWFYAREEAPPMWLTEGPVQELPGGGWRLPKRACVYQQDLPEAWNGALDSEVEAKVVLRSLAPGARATAMLWVGDATPKMSCVLYLQAATAGDAVSFGESMEPRYSLADSGKVHRYRVLTNHAAKTAQLFVDDAAQPALTTPLGAALQEFNLNRVLFGDPNVDWLGGESDLLSLRWKNGK